MVKNKLREQMILTLKRINSNEKRKIENHMLEHLTSSSLWKNARTIGMTISSSFEWDTRIFIEQAWRENKRIVVPKSMPNTKQLIFYMIDTYEQLVKGYANLFEPDPLKAEMIHKTDIDLLVVPGIVFDNQGYRIGFGGGYYDRFLENLNVLTVSLVSELQLVDTIPIDQFDIAVQYLVTEKGVIKSTS